MQLTCNIVTPLPGVGTRIKETRSEKGLENHSVLRGLFETARRQGKKAHRFYLDLFTKNAVQAHAALYRNPLPKKSDSSWSSPAINFRSEYKLKLYDAFLENLWHPCRGCVLVGDDEPGVSLRSTPG